MFANSTLTIIILIVVSIIAAYFSSKNKSMPFGWGLFFCLFYSPLIGTIIILSSGKYGHSYKYLHRGNFWWEFKKIACFLVGAFFIIYGFIKYPSGSYHYTVLGTEYTDPIYEMNMETAIIFIRVGIGLIGNFGYLLSSDGEYMKEEGNTSLNTDETI